MVILIQYLWHTSRQRCTNLQKEVLFLWGMEYLHHFDLGVGYARIGCAG
jgi:hypothetical protein